MLRNKRKKIVLISSIIALLTICVGTTIAFIITQSPTLLNTFTSGFDKETDIQIGKVVEHPFPSTYVIPEHIEFDFIVDLGNDYENDSVTVAGEEVSLEDGKVKVNVKPGSSVLLEDILVGTKVNVTEIDKENDGFTPEKPTHGLDVVGNKKLYLNALNIYEPSPAPTDHIKITAVKEIEGREWQEGDSFTFHLQYKTPGSEEWIDLGDKTVGYSSEENFNHFDIKDLVDLVSFDELGEFSFKLSEVKGDIGGFDYTPVSYFDVVVTDDDMDGYYEINGIEGYSNVIVSEFINVLINIKNEYAPEGSAEVNINIQKILNDLSGQYKTTSGFIFDLYDSEGNIIKTSEATTAAGETMFSLIYDATDVGKVYHYVLKERNTEISGMKYSEEAYDIKVEIIDNLDGTISCKVNDEDINSINLSFTNTYDPEDAKVTLSGTKELVGRDLKDKEFVFELYETDQTYTIQDTYIDETTNTKEGTFSFKEITYSEVGVHYYIIKERNNSIGGVNYDLKEYPIKVTIHDENGTLIASVESEPIHFKNTYQASPAYVNLKGNKIYEGQELKVGMFTFELYEKENDTLLQKTTNALDGSFEFRDLVFDQEGTYHYYVKENSSTSPLMGVAYDRTVYDITITITDNFKGSYEAKVESDELIFKNTYSPLHATHVISGKKEFQDYTLENGMFTFRLYEANENYEMTNDEPIRITKNEADGTFAFDAITYTKDEIGNHYYIVKEDHFIYGNYNDIKNRIRYDERNYGICLTVTDDGNGQVQLQEEVIELESKEVSELIFKNIYIPEPEDLTINITIQKSVQNLGTEQITPEGFKFSLEKEDKVVSEVIMEEDGEITLPLLFTYEDIGQHTYKLSEVNDKEDHVTYSNKAYYFSIDIHYNDNNELEATILMDDKETEAITCAFENIYDFSIYNPDTADHNQIIPYTISFTISMISLIGLLMVDKKRIFG